MKYVNNIVCMAVLSLNANAQKVDTIAYCTYPDEDAKPPLEWHEMLEIVLDHQGDKTSNCFEPFGEFYYNITILSDGSVAEFNLECFVNGESCYISVEDPTKLEKWKPAIFNGENCHQKMRLKTYIHFE